MRWWHGAAGRTGTGPGARPHGFAPRDRAVRGRTGRDRRRSPAQVEIAGQQVSVRPVVGQDTSRLFDGALIRPQHADIAGKPVGLDVDADWNKLVPTDKQTRSYLVSLWRTPPRDPPDHRRRASPAAAVGAGRLPRRLLAVGVVVGLWWQRRCWLWPATSRGRRAGGAPGQPPAAQAVLVVGAVAGALALDAQAVRVWAHDDRQTLVATSSLDGTPWRAPGDGAARRRAALLVGPPPRSSFYDTVADNLAVALAQRGAMAPRTARSCSSPPTTSRTSTGWPVRSA